MKQKLCCTISRNLKYMGTNTCRNVERSNYKHYKAYNNGLWNKQLDTIQILKGRLMPTYSVWLTLLECTIMWKSQSSKIVNCNWQYRPCYMFLLQWAYKGSVTRLKSSHKTFNKYLIHTGFGIHRAIFCKIWRNRMAGRADSILKRL